ncbi:MAG: hypothetical protein LH470_08170, partial [Lysobacter sp.]|nr:hypothetical protein [Lysobacter sp.]
SEAGQAFQQRSWSSFSTAKLVKLFNSEAGQALQQRSWSSFSTAKLVKLFCPFRKHSMLEILADKTCLKILV